MHATIRYSNMEVHIEFGCFNGQFDIAYHDFCFEACRPFYFYFKKCFIIFFFFDKVMFDVAQLTFTWSKLTIETLEKDAKCVQS